MVLMYGGSTFSTICENAGKAESMIKRVVAKIFDITGI
jgi:hypothetical protein